MKKTKIGFWRRFKHHWIPFFHVTVGDFIGRLANVLFFLFVIVMIVWLTYWCHTKLEECKATELEIRHIIVEGDQSAIDIEKIDQVESCGFVVRKIVVSNKMTTFHIERENGKYLWIYNRSRNEDISVVPLIDDLSY